MKAIDLATHDIVPTALPSLNEILGGGFPTKIIIEVAGPPASGKSTLALQFIAQAQRLGRPCYYADAERAINFVEFATNIGVDCKALEYDKQPYAEALLQNLIIWAQEKKNGVIVVDAVGSLLGREEAEKDMDGRIIGVQSRMIATFCRRLIPIIDDNNHILIMVNHVYTDIQFGRIKSSGGAKLEYHKGLALWLKEAFGKPAKRTADGTKTIKFIEAEVKNKAKYAGAFEGRKILLELIPKKGFVGEFVSAPEPKKRGRPAKS